MITELALLRLKPGAGPAFEAAFAGVASLLIGADGYLRHRLVPTLDDTDVYLLEVHWRDLAAHTEGFEPSNAHAHFMAPLERILAGEPTIAHVPGGQHP